MEKKLSVIVPVYNVKDYLEKCIDSIVNQTYKNLEIIIVDDGATDGSGELCDELAKSDDRIKVVHKVNGGLSDARNAGMDVATGDYIGFIDSDDYPELDMFEILVSNLEKYDADVSCCRYIKFYEDGERTEVGNDHQIYVYEGLDGLKEYLYGKTMDPFVWNKLYKREVIGDTRFIKGIVGEDNPFNTEIFKRTDKIVLAGESKYNYLQKRAGAITSNMSPKRVESVFWWDKMRLDCHDNYPDLEKYALRRQVLFYVGLYNQIYKDKNYEKEKQEIIKFVKSHKKEIMKSDICEKQIKISATMLSKSETAYSVVMKTYKKLLGEARL